MTLLDWLFAGFFGLPFAVFVCFKVWQWHFSPEARAYELGYYHFGLGKEECPSDYFQSSQIQYAYYRGFRRARADSQESVERILRQQDKQRLMESLKK